MFDRRLVGNSEEEDNDERLLRLDDGDVDGDEDEEDDDEREIRRD